MDVRCLRHAAQPAEESDSRNHSSVCSHAGTMSVDSVFRTRSLGVAAEGLPDQYADGKAAKVWELYIGDTQSRTQEYKSWVVSLLRENGVRRVLDVACGTG